jgi:prevent-host-death family protein
MTRMGIRELRDNLTAVVRRVRAGETVEVTHDGEPVAVLAPMGRCRLEELVASGQATAPIRPLTLPLTRYPNTSGRPTQEILDDLRSDRF